LSPPWSPRARLKPWRLLNRGVYSNGIQTTSTADRYRSTYNPNPAAYHVRLPIYLPRTPCLYKYVVVDSFPRHLKGYPLALAPAAWAASLARLDSVAFSFLSISSKIFLIHWCLCILGPCRLPSEIKITYFKCLKQNDELDI
jgi:hypothetical protein